jgi:hypothetical protein
MSRNWRPSRRQAARGAALILHTGGNDILHWTPLGRVDRAIDRLLHHATALAEHVIVVTGGNLALAPGIFPPFSWLWGWRHSHVRRHLLKHVCGARVTYVDLFRSAEDDPTRVDPQRYFAPDGLHPSDENDALWWEEIRRALIIGPSHRPC